MDFQSVREKTDWKSILRSAKPDIVGDNYLDQLLDDSRMSMEPDTKFEFLWSEGGVTRDPKFRHSSLASAMEHVNYRAIRVDGTGIQTLPWQLQLPTR